MKKKLKTFVYIALLILVAVISTNISSCSNKQESLSLRERIRKLEDKNQELNQTVADQKKELTDVKKKNKSLNKQLNNLRSSDSVSMDTRIMDAIFWKKGTNFVSSDKTLVFYKDMDCNNPASNSLTFATDIWLEFERSNGYTVYTYRTTNGYVFSPNKVDFVTK